MQTPYIYIKNKYQNLSFDPHVNHGSLLFDLNILSL